MGGLRWQPYGKNFSVGGAEFSIKAAGRGTTVVDRQQVVCIKRLLELLLEVDAMIWGLG